MRMMKKRLATCLEEAKKQAQALPNKSEFANYGALVYFTPSHSGGLPVHLVLDTFVAKEFPSQNPDSEDFLLLSEGEILGEISDCYEGIKSFIREAGTDYDGKLSVFMEDLLVLFHGLIDKNPFTVEDIITILESCSENGDFSLWNFDLGVGFRITEKIA